MPGTDNLLRQRIHRPGHFSAAVQVEAVRPRGSGFELQVRRADGALDETIPSADEMRGLLAAVDAAPSTVTAVDDHLLRLFVESARIHLAYAHDC